MNLFLHISKVTRVRLHVSNLPRGIDRPILQNLFAGLRVEVKDFFIPKGPTG
jgi:hypothetical protein